MLKYLRIAWSVACIAAIIVIAGCDPSKISPPVTNTSGVVAERPKSANELTRSIPLAAIVSTSGQHELEDASSGTKNGEYVVPYGQYLQQLYEGGGGGASNIYLVDAPTITDAVQITTRVARQYATADWPTTLNKPDPPRGNYWLVAFLGMRGSNPTHWLVDSVTVQGNQIRFNYHGQGGGARTKDIHQYYYWIPLGYLKSGRYTLELYETALNEVTLMRRVDVK
jgi:hypothetical protein